MQYTIHLETEYLKIKRSKKKKMNPRWFMEESEFIKLTLL